MQCTVSAKQASFTLQSSIAWMSHLRERRSWNNTPRYMLTCLSLLSYFSESTENTQWKHLQSRKKIIPKESPLRFPVGNQTLTEMSFALLVFSVFLSSLWKRQNDSQWQLISFWEIHWHPFQQARSHRRSQDRAVPAGEIPSLSTGKSEADQLKVKLLSIFSVTNCVILFIVLN